MISKSNNYIDALESHVAGMGLMGDPVPMYL